MPANSRSVCGQQIPSSGGTGDEPRFPRTRHDHTCCIDRARSYAICDGGQVAGHSGGEIRAGSAAGGVVRRSPGRTCQARSRAVDCGCSRSSTRRASEGARTRVQPCRHGCAPLDSKLCLPSRLIPPARNRPRPEKQVRSLEQRWESVRGGFATQKGSRVDNLGVLLVDDVMTTGATPGAGTRVVRSRCHRTHRFDRWPER
jgi:hypothetical protein